MRNTRFAWILVLVAIAALIGCGKGDKLAGTWNVAGMPMGSATMPMGSATTTFEKGDAMTMVVKASAPGMGELTMTMKGTYKLEGNNLTMTLSSVDVKSGNQMASDAAKKAMESSLNKPDTGTITWKGDDEFTQVSTRGTLTFTRQK